MAAKRQSQTTTSSTEFAFAELGATGLREFSGYVREEWMRELTGWRGLRMYREMEDNDPVIGAFLFAIEMLFRTVSFSIEPASKSPDDMEAAAFVDSCVTDMEQAWPDMLSEILSFLPYGFQVSEIVYKLRDGPNKDPTRDSRFDDGLIGWRKFAPRSQETLLHWEFDESGDAAAMVQLLPTGGPLLRVPLAKCLHFRTRSRKSNPEGRSILRVAYTSYYRKKNIEQIEAMGVERDLVGLPVAEVPARLLNVDASASDKAQLESIKAIVRDTYRNEQEGIVWPLVYDSNNNPMYKLSLLTTGGRRQFDTSGISDRYAKRIAMTVLADFLLMGLTESGRGSYGLAKNKSDMFAIAITGFLDLICAEFNRSAIPPLLALNQMEGRCLMQHGDISQRDVQEFATAVMDVANAGMLTPDPQVEAAIREELGLPAQEGEPLEDIEIGGAAEQDQYGDAAATQSDLPADAQGRGQGAGAAQMAQPIVPLGSTAKRRGGVRSKRKSGG